jgi:hypothetical protein
MNDSDKLQAICADREAHRAEIVEVKSSLINLLFAFLTFAAGGAGVYWGETVIKNPIVRAWLLFAAAQIEFLLSMLFLQLLLDIATHSAYIAALEKKINQLLGETVTAWESGVIKIHYYTRRSAVYWNSIILGLLFLVIFLGLMVMAALQSKSVLVAVVLLSEVVLFAVMAVLTFNEPERTTGAIESSMETERNTQSRSPDDVETRTPDSCR